MFANGSIRRTLQRGALLASIGFLLPGSVLAVDPGSLSGTLDVTGVTGEVGDQDRRTVKQDYRVQWDRTLFPTIQLHAGYRFYRFDLDEATQSYRRETRPDGSLTWNHPLFTFGASAARRETRTNQAAGDLTADDLGLSLRTRSDRYPIVGVRFDSNELTDRGADVPRKTRDRRLQGSLDKTSGAYTLGYGYAYRTTDNLVTDISSSEQSHRWRMVRAASPVLGNRLRMGGSYTFAYRERRDERSGPGGVLELIPAGVGLYREDPSPEQDPLAPVGGLTDGDTQNAVEPVIDIGGALVDRNIGVDLAFERGVDAIYLYVDRPSGPLTWRVFTSVDNLNWAQVSGVTAFFNAALQRYEISFAQTRTRYLKVVNGGLNSAAEVFVTEIEALAQVTGQAESMRFHRSHLADLTAFYSVTRNLSTQAGLTFQDEPPQGGESQHRTLGYLVSSRYHQSRMIEHDVRWEQGFQFLGEGGEDQIDQTVSYGLRVDPWATLGLAVGAAHRKIRIESRDYQEDNNVSLRLRGEPLRGWGFRVETTRSRSLQYVAGTRADTWNQRVATDITLTDAIRTTLSGTHQWTRSEPDEDTRRRWTYRADLELRPTRTIFLRGSLDVLDDDLVDTWGREATLIWTPAPKLSASASASLHDSSTDFDTRRYDTNVTYRVNPRTSVYFQSNRIDFSGAGGSDTASYQVGLRTGF